MKKLGIIAGGGDIPTMLIKHCIKISRPFFVLPIKGNADDNLIQNIDKSIEHKFIKIGEAGTGFKLLKDNGCEEITLIGTIKRPTIGDLVPDMRTAKFFMKAGMHARGDDGMLRSLIKEIEADGFIVKGIHEVLPDILVSDGLLTKTKPNKEDIEDIKKGVKLATEICKLDVGQSVVVQNGLTLGLEAIEGTDELIKRCADYKRKGKGAVLVKIRKPEQDERADLPTIGSQTIERAHQSGFKGIAIHSKNALVINQEEVVALANKYKMFIIGINPQEYI